MKLKGLNLDPFTVGYLRAALWSTFDQSTPSGGVPLNRNYTIGDIVKASLRKMKEDCEAFQRENQDLLAKAWLERSMEELGHDFWLSRNGHGTGFWDRGLGEVGDQLHEKAAALHDYNLYVWRKKIYS